MGNSSLRKHDHAWSFEHTQYEGRNEDETAVVRYCACGVKQMAFASDWKTPPKAYDLSNIDEEIENLNR